MAMTQLLLRTDLVFIKSGLFGGKYVYMLDYEYSASPGVMVWDVGCKGYKY